MNLRDRPTVDQPTRDGGGPGRAVAWAAAAVVLAAALAAVSLTDADPDLWGHVLFGRATLEHGLERVDPYSFTAQGRRWVNHEWAAEVLMAATWELTGDRGLLIGKISVGVVTVMLLAAAARLRSRSALIEATVVPVAAWAMSPGYLHRPQVLSFLLFAVVLWILHAHDTGRRRAVWALPLVMAVWPNLHGGFLMGGAAVAVAVTVRSVVAVARPAERRGLVGLWIAAALAAVATLCTPYGWQLHRFLFGSLSVPRPIGEWAPLDLFDGSFPAVTLLVVACAVVAAARWRGVRWWEAILIALLLVATLRHQRHAPFFAMAATPFLVTGFVEMLRSNLLGRLARPASGRLRGLVATALCVVALAWAGTAVARVAVTGGRIGVDPVEFPVDAVRFVHRAELTGRLVLPFEWGEYAIWHLWPACRVSVDGRFRTVYPEEILEAHYAAHVDTARWPALAEDLDGDLLLAPRDTAVERAVGSGWTVVYADRTALVAARRGVGNDDAIADIASGRVARPDVVAHPTFP
jgi:hypothetical protein